MKLQAQAYEIETGGILEAEEFGMETTDPAVIQIMLENIYPDPYVWPRELLANWMDAGGGGSLTLPEAIDPMWVIEDHGDGMDHEFMMKRYTKIFASNKRHNDDAIGGFGHGRLSPLAYTDTYNVRSRFMHEGEVWEGNYLIYRGENRIPKISAVSLGLSDVQQTGVTVTIPIGVRDIPRIVERTRFYASYLAQQPEGMSKVSYKYQNAYGGHREDDGNEMRGVRLILGGVPYPAPRELRFNDGAPVDIFFALGELQPTLARDAINADADTLEKIRQRLTTFGGEYAEVLQKEIAAEPSVLDRYALYSKVYNTIPYSLRTIIKIDTVEPVLSGEEIFKTLKGDFSLHSVQSDIDNHRYKGMAVADSTLKSIRGLAIKKLISNGLIRRNGGDEHGKAEGLNFSSYVPRYGQTNQGPNIVLFAIKAPYVTGQIKLIKEAIAAKLAEMREAGTLGQDAYALLIQYSDEQTAKDLAKLISPKLTLNWITDTSKRVELNPYISVLVVDGTKRSWGDTKAVRVSQLDNKNYVFYVRQDKERVDTTRNIFHVLINMEDSPFKNRILIGVSPNDAKYIPKKHTQALGMAVAYFRKKMPHTYDPAAVQAAIVNVNRQKKAQGETGILSTSARGGTGYADKTKPRMIDALLDHPSLKDNVELQEIKKVLDSEASSSMNALLEIRDRGLNAKSLIDYGFMKADMLTGKQPLPTVDPIDLKKVDDFYVKYPLLPLIDSEYNLRNYGYEPKVLQAIIPYIK